MSSFGCEWRAAYVFDTGGRKCFHRSRTPDALSVGGSGAAEAVREWGRDSFYLCGSGVCGPGGGTWISGSQPGDGLSGYGGGAVPVAEACGGIAQAWPEEGSMSPGGTSGAAGGQLLCDGSLSPGTWRDGVCDFDGGLWHASVSCGLCGEL